MIPVKQLTYQDVDRDLVTLIRAANLAKRLEISKATLYRWVKDPKLGFPRQINIGPRVAAWRIADIEEFLARQEGKNDAA